MQQNCNHCTNSLKKKSLSASEYCHLQSTSCLPSLSSHSNYCHVWKHSWKSFSEMYFSSVITLLSKSSSNAKRDPPQPFQAKHLVTRNEIIYDLFFGKSHFIESTVWMFIVMLQIHNQRFCNRFKHSKESRAITCSKTLFNFQTGTKHTPSSQIV